MIVDNKFTTFPVASRETHERNGRGHPLPGTPEMWLALSVPPAGADRTYAPKESPCSELRSGSQPAVKPSRIVNSWSEPGGKMPRWAARCRKRRRSEFRTTNGEREVMPSPSAPIPSSGPRPLLRAGKFVGNSAVGRRQRPAGGGSSHNLTPLVGVGWEEREDRWPSRSPDSALSDDLWAGWG